MTGVRIHHGYCSGVDEEHERDASALREATLNSKVAYSDIAYIVSLTFCFQPCPTLGPTCPALPCPPLASCHILKELDVPYTCMQLKYAPLHAIWHAGCQAEAGATPRQRMMKSTSSGRGMGRVRALRRAVVVEDIVVMVGLLGMAEGMRLKQW